MTGDSNYILIDSINANVLNDIVEFRTFKSDQGLLVEGFIFDNHHRILTKVFFDKKLRLYMWGKAKDPDDIRAIIQILKTLKIR